VVVRLRSVSPVTCVCVCVVCGDGSMNAGGIVMTPAIRPQVLQVLLFMHE
jgi:hypothetical protein